MDAVGARGNGLKIGKGKTQFLSPKGDRANPVPALYVSPEDELAVRVVVDLKTRLRAFPSGQEKQETTVLRWRSQGFAEADTDFPGSGIRRRRGTTRKASKRHDPKAKPRLHLPS